MFFYEHWIMTFVVGGISLLALDAFSWGAMWIMLIVTTVIDFDHAVQYLVTQRNLDFKKGYRYYMRQFKTKKQRFYIFHTLEFHLVLFYLSFQSWTMFLIFFSAIMHLLADQLNYYFHHKALKDVQLWTTSGHIRSGLKRRVKANVRKKVKKYENLHRKRR